MTTQIRRAIMASQSKPTATLANYGDIVYLDGAEERKVVPSDKWDSSLGTPIGVIAVPTGFAPDGIARFVSLHYIAFTSGVNAAYKKMTWGTVADTELYNYAKVPITSTDGSYPNGNFTGFLPSDDFSGAGSRVDSMAFYSGDTPYIPSPYKVTNGVEAPNPEYYKTLPDGNALSDFDGKGNTQILLNLFSYPAAISAANNLTEGARWYLPAVGELGFLIARLKTINRVIVNIIGGAMIKDDFIWSSTEDGANYAFAVDASDGQVISNSKTVAGAGVRPFAMLDD